MTRLQKTSGTPGASRLLVAEFDGYVRDGATFQLIGSQASLQDGDLIAFRDGEQLSAGITISEDAQGLHSLIRFGAATFLRIGLEAQGNGVYALRPTPQHMELWPELASTGNGAKIT